MEFATANKEPIQLTPTDQEFPMLIAPPQAVVDQMALLDERLDLSMIRFKLANPEEGSAPSIAKMDAMEQEYRRFLALHLLYPGVDIVPCKLVDEMWHRHILDTAAYRRDCDAIFGRFLDHFPYFGLRGDDDAVALEDAYDVTLDLYREAFGEPPADTWISADASSRCRKGCKPMRCK